VRGSVEQLLDTGPARQVVTDRFCHTAGKSLHATLNHAAPAGTGAYGEMLSIDSVLPTCLVSVASPEAALLAGIFGVLAELQNKLYAEILKENEASAVAATTIDLLQLTPSLDPILVVGAEMSGYRGTLDRMAQLLSAWAGLGDGQSNTSRRTNFVQVPPAGVIIALCDASASPKKYAQDLYLEHPDYDVSMSYSRVVGDLDSEESAACLQERSNTVRFRFANFTHAFNSSATVSSVSISRR
jgi:hypothetical protein